MVPSPRTMQSLGLPFVKPFYLSPVQRSMPIRLGSPYLTTSRRSARTSLRPTRYGVRHATTGTKTQPLNGITVVAIEQAVAAPFCTRQLADLGARVIKIERPGQGDFNRYHDERVNGLCSHFVWTNRSKESLALDLKEPEDLSILKQLIERKADVVVQNLAPGATARMGLSYDQLSKTKPGIIVCDISGYGSNGPYRDKKAYDLLIQSEGGFLSVTGSPGAPAKAGCSISDIAAGMYGLTNILTALYHRKVTGEGCHLDVSMLESTVEWMSFPMYYAFNGAPAPKQSGAAHASIYPYGPFVAGDNQAVMLGMQNDREWVSFCDVALEQPSLARDARFDTTALRSANRDVLKQIIEEVFAKLSIQEVIARLDKAKIANSKVNTMADIWSHPQLQERGRWKEVNSAVGPIPALMPPGLSESFEARMDPIPSVGQHNEQILAELKAAQ